MIEDRKVTIREKDYSMRFPSLGRIKQLGKLLKFDPLRDGIVKADFASLFDDESTIQDFLNLILEDVNASALMDDLTAGDISMLASAFFLKGQQAHLTLRNGLASFVDSFNQSMGQPSRKDTGSISPSISLVPEIPKESDGRGTI